VPGGGRSERVWEGGAFQSFSNVTGFTC
jgi:hypothetical protein